MKLPPWGSRVLATSASLLVVALHLSCTAKDIVTDIPADVARVELTAAKQALLVGESEQLSATPYSAQNNAMGARLVSFASDHPEVLTVDASGLVRGVSKGTATVTATAGSASKALDFTVTRAPAVALSPAGVSFSALAGGSDPQPQTVQVTNGGDGTLTGVAAQVTYGAGQAQGWLTAQPGGASAPTTVTLRATVGGLAAGTYQATVQVSGTGAVAQPLAVTLTVGAAPVASVRVQPDSATLNVGQSRSFQATTLDAAGNALLGRSVTWTISDTTVASVAGQGGSSALVTARGPGLATLRATSEGKSGQATVAVLTPAYTLTVTGGGSGSGTVTSTPAGISCTITAGVGAGSCAFGFVAGTAVTLTAAGTGGSSFNGFGGACTGTSCQLTLARDSAVTATFTAPPATFAISTASNPAAGGTTAGGGNYTAGAQVTVTATPSAGYYFVSWTENGAMASSQPTYTFPASIDRALVANFAANPKLTVSGGGSGSGTVTSAPAGISCTVTGGVASGTCKAVFPRGTSVSLSATATGGGSFTGFSGGCTGASCQLTLSRDSAVTATFVASYTITTSSSPAAGGSTTGGGTYTGGSTVTVTATPAAGFGFVSWTENGATVSSQPGYAFTAAANRALVANFSPNPTLTVTGSGTGSGSVASTPAGISCTVTAGVASGTCRAAFPRSTSVQLSATASGGGSFTGFSGACTGASCQITVVQDSAVTAAFVAPNYTISTSSSPAAGGTTSGGGSFSAGTAVTVTATAAVGYSFVSWTENGTVVSSSASYGFSASANRVLVANFALNPKLTVTGAGSGSGTVSSTPAGIGCTITAGVAAGSCQASFAPGSSISLTASPAASVFSGFSGACSGATCQLTLTRDTVVTATFTATYIIGTSSSPAAGGSTTGAATYTAGAHVTVVATPATGYSFVSWTENGTVVSSQASYGFTASANRSLVANFVLNPRLTVAGSGSGSGTVTSAPAGISCAIAAGVASGACQSGFPPGSSITLSAAAGASSIFPGFSGACSGTTCQITLTRDTVVAVAFIATYTVSTSASPAGAGSLTGAGTYIAGAAVTVTAAPAPGFTFVSWTENGSVVSSQPSYAFTAAANRVLVANFAPYPRLSVTGSGSGSGTVSSTPAGISCTITAGVASGTCQSSFAPGTSIALAAAATGGGSFLGFSGACTGTSCQLTLSKDTAVTAAFAASYTIATSSSPAAGGTTTGGGTYVAGTAVTVTATAAAGYFFVSWTENGSVVSSQASYGFSAAANRVLVANFALNPVLTVTGAGTGSGTVTSTPAGITCTVTAGAAGGTCQSSFAPGTSITLAAAATGGGSFSGFSGACTGTTCQLTLNRDTTVSATFIGPVYTIATSSNPAAGGTTSGGGSYAATSAVTVTATPAAGYTFVSWTENSAVVSTQASYSFTAAANRSLVANFAPSPRLTVTGAGTGSGSVTSSPVGISCTITAGAASGTCQSTFPSGTPVTLTGTATGGGTFTGFGGACTGTSCQLTLTQDSTVSATFTAPVASFTIATSSNPAAGGSTSGGGSFSSGASVTVTATPAAGYTFVSWTENSAVVSTQASYSFTVAANRTLVANFAPSPTLTVTGAGTGSGSVTSSPAGISCTITAGAASGTCQSTFPSGTPVTLTGTATGGGTFSGFGGACTGTSCQLTLTQDSAVTATFTAPPPPAPDTLALGLSGAGSGTVTVNGQAFHYTGSAQTLSLTFPTGTALSLQAQPDSGFFFFSGWMGACSGLTATCSLTLNQNAAVGASFDAASMTLAQPAPDTLCNHSSGNCTNPTTTTLSATVRGTAGGTVTFSTTSGTQIGSSSTPTISQDASGVSLFTYTVTLDATGFQVGSYTVQATATSGSNTLQSNTVSVQVVPQ